MDNHNENKTKSFADKIKDFAVKLQNLPENQKRIVFFAVIGISILIAGIIQIQITKNNILKLNKSLKSMNLPSIEREGLSSQEDEDADILDNLQPIGDFTDNEEEFLDQDIQDIQDTQDISDF